MYSLAIILVLFCICAYHTNYAFETASFYGSSYITIPLQDAKSTTEIHLRFRTKQADALLFLAAGKTDYCLIKLQSGKLKVHINLGAGEPDLPPPKGLRLDDLVWHQVSLSRKDGVINVTIDNIHVIKGKLPGRFFELNIYDGLYLGGSGDSLDLFLGHFDWLRGCLSAVFYNGVDVLKRARYRTLQSDAHGVTWSCSSEFDAHFHSEISFMDERAFVSLPNPISRTGVRWQFEMKTTKENSILFYNSKFVQGGRTDYVGLEITNRKLRLVMDTGSGTTEVLNDAPVTDGEWHSVMVQVNPTYLEITVDGKLKTTAQVVAKTGNKYLDLSDVVYVGGLELNKRANALTVGMKTADISFEGCLRNMEADGKLLGFPNAKVTQGVLPNCMWTYGCSKNPCIINATCSQHGVDSFTCECNESKCVKDDHEFNQTSLVKPSLPEALEILSLNPVQVMEGETSPITFNNINVIMDYAKYGIRDSSVIFNVTQTPRHGSINIGSSGIASHVIDVYTEFTLMNLAGEKVFYVHDGSETVNDSVIIELQFVTNVGYNLPTYLKGKNSFDLHIDIAPVNDPPFLFITQIKMFRVAEGTRKLVTNEFLNATDSDNNNSELVYLVLNQAGSNANGFMAKVDALKVPVYSFTQEDVDQRKVFYVHNGNMTGEDKIMLQVSDGVLTSSISSLRLSIFSLQVHLINNTGIVLAQKSSTIITNDNMAFETNADDPFINVKYDIVDNPKYGEIQTLIRVKNNQEIWQKTTSFTQQQILREELRYSHVEDTLSTFDLFKFRVSVKHLISPMIYDFRVTFVQLKLTVKENKTVELREKQTVFIEESHLKAITEPLSTNSSTITYTLLREPKVARLMLGDKIVKFNDTWLQKDIDDAKLAFHLFRKTMSNVDDEIVFSISAPQCDTLERLRLRFKYKPSDEQRNCVQVTMRTIQVTEGGQQPVLWEHLHILKENFSLVAYQVLEGPKHGWLDMYDVDHTTVEKRNVTQFTNSDIMKQKVTYTHDDSESVNDTIVFIAYGEDEEEEDNFQYVGELGLEIVLKNDNPPHCVANHGLDVVVGSVKILTSRDLLYGDADMDAKPETISYIRRAIPFGSFTLSEPPYNQLFEFSQNDINNGKVMFRHSGPLSGNISMWVSDGNSHSEFSFEVNASDPYVKIANKSKLLVRQGGEATMSTSNLLTITNMNVSSQSIRYKVLKPPSVGQLHLSGQANAIDAFTQYDVDANALVYRHVGDAKSVEDKFFFEVNAEDIYVKDVFHIRLFSAVYWEPLVLINNKTVLVDESSDVQITRDDLLVQQARVPPSDITYHVVEHPKNGYLELEMDGRYLEVDFNYLFHPNSSDESKDTAIATFDQSIVDAERLHYIQVLVNQTYDRVVLDVTNGIVWLRNIVVNFVIIPEQMYLNGGELTLDEGDTVKVAATLLKPYSPYYAKRVNEYRLKKYPLHGYLLYVGATSKSENISKWSANELLNEQIMYVHDGSETTNDSIVVIAYAGDKESTPTRINIVVRPVNDEVPIIVNNTGASVWRGGTSLLTSTNLAFVDKDTPNTNLTYVIVSAQSGYLAYISNLNDSIDKFTQSDIDSNKITFVHSGEETDGEFDFVVNDTKHIMKPITFRVKILHPSLRLRKSVDFEIFPMLRKAITSHHLLTLCSDAANPIFYAVKTPPKYGALLAMVDSNLTSPVTNFSQADVNASRIWYHHTAHISDSIVSNDSFTFDVIANYAAPILDETFDIKIAVSSGGLDSMLDIETYEVDEGGEVKLFVNTSHLLDFLSSENIGLRSFSLRAITAVPPQHGELCIQENCSVSEFTNDDMNAGVVYRHDDSDSRSDNVTLTLFLDEDNITLCNVTLHVQVIPKNDQEFQLVQDSPNLTVVQGERFVLTPDQLHTVDKDSYPDELVYDIVSGPTIGSLWVNGAKDAVRFTQADINAGKVVYEHSGPVQNGQFHFRVSDGQFDPKYKLFDVFVQVAKLSVSVTRPVILMQGSNATTVLSSIFNVQTNHRANEVVYTVTTSPRYGFILVNAARNVTFSHNDLKSKRVVYVQSDLSQPNDTFELEANLPAAESNVKNLWINISVEPLLKLGNFYPVAGAKNLVDEEILNAAELAKRPNANPQFEIIAKPKYGKLLKIFRRNRKGNEKQPKHEDANQFTFDEVNSKIIYYVAKKTNVSLEDSFVYRLSANSVQPAFGELKFHISTESSNPRAAATTPKQRNPSSKSKSKTADDDDASVADDTDVEIASSNVKSDDFYLYVCLLVGIVVLFIVSVCVVRCVSKRKRNGKDKKTNAPLPLPRPPNDLLPSSPYSKRNNIMSTPQCKVIPLGTDSMTSSEHDFNLRYPYGVADEDWSSYDTNGYSGRSNNPMLRKNQYWV